MATNTSIDTSWVVDSTTGLPVTFNFRWRLSGSIPWNVVTGLPALGYSGQYILTGLQPNQTIDWQVQSVNAAGASGWSSSAFCSTLTVILTTAFYIDTTIGYWKADQIAQGVR